MKSITEHLDDLDRMVDAGNTPKHELRSQIAFIGREVAALETAYARLYDDHEKFKLAHPIAPNTKPEPPDDPLVYV